MAPPLPQPRLKSARKLNSDSTDVEDHGSDSSFFQSRPTQVVHTVEVHNAVGDTSTNGEDNSSKSSERRKRKLKRKGTYSVSKCNSQKSYESIKSSENLEIQSLNGSEKKCRSGTVSDASSSPASSQIKLIPLIGKEKRKKPSGYATETLSEDSNSEREKVNSNDKVNRVDKHEDFTQRESASILQEPLPSREDPEPFDDGKSIQTSERCGSPPVALARKLINKSLENLLDDNQSSAQGSPTSYCTSSSIDYRDTGTLPKQRIKKHRKKKKHKDLDTEKVDKETVHELNIATLTPKSTEKTPKKILQNERKFICLTINKCEALNIKDYKSRPYVKVTFMEVDGKPKMSSKGDVLEPLVTQPCDLSCQRSPIPCWNQDLIVMEPLETVLSTNTIFIFEIFNEKGKGIAWAFLKPVAANGVSNSGKKLRLQLFKQGKLVKDSSVPQAFHWWKKLERKKYNSTLFITLTGIPESIIVQNRVGESSKANEESSKSLNKSVTDILTESEDHDLEDVKWSRLPSLSCKLPNKYLARLPAGPDGSIAVAYSRSGLLLASANKGSIGVFTFRGHSYLSLQGHTGLVYNLKWSPNDRYLLSASADFTSCIWDVSNKIPTPLQTMPHPSYVYCCSWLDNLTVATGCFDSDIRIWKVGSSSVHQQVSRHAGQVNSLLTYDNFLASGDSTGEIFIWKRNSDGHLEFEKDLKIREIRGKVINKLCIHPGKKRLLVHTRDSVLRMVDLATGSVLHWFQGSVNNKLREDSTFCGCGSLIFAWSEDSTLCVWDSNTGTQAAVYPGLIPDSRPGVVDFHPRDHMMAISAFSSVAPTLSILMYDRKSSGRDVGLVCLKGNINPTLTAIEQNLPSHDKSESTTRKKENILKTLLGSRRKVKTVNTTPSIENSFTDFSKIHGVSRQIEMLGVTDKENRLTDIIKRMDKLLSTVSHNNGSLYTS